MDFQFKGAPSPLYRPFPLPTSKSTLLSSPPLFTVFVFVFLLLLFLAIPLRLCRFSCRGMENREDDYFYTEDEFEVSEILLELPELVQRSQNRFFNVRWGSKRRRSAEEDGLSPSPSLAAAAAARSVNNGGGESHVKVEASSPATPLCFSPSDTECKSRPSKRTAFKKKTTKELMEMVRELGAQQEQLKLEISKVMKYRDGLRDDNLQLKSKQLKMKHHHGSFVEGRVDEDEQPAVTTSTAPKTEQPPPSTTAQQTENLRRREETVSCANAVEHHYRKIELPYAAIPDLNCSAVEEAGDEEAIGFDFYNYGLASKAAAAAQARKRRLEIHRVKNSAAFKSQLQQQQQQQLRFR
ncbi:uncharacterized protein [Aristolochia californica]|uniref:uncharacterized protein n=1 Tax=Aristolochia californica TaxID=171875 RepID=UPI0035E2998B